jgi:RimJ/RimL family protein N-acetyltransferase
MLTLPHASLDIDVLHTERLCLRGYRFDDFAACAAMWTDPQVTRYTTGRPLSEEEIWTRFLRAIGHWSLLGFGYWAVEEKATGSFVGELGFADLKRDPQPSLQGLPEMGWIFSSAVHGKGYASEAVRAALAWGKPRFAPKQAVCLISPENYPSIRLAANNGFREFQRTTYKGDPVILFRNQEV